MNAIALSDNEFIQLIKNAPLIAIDLIVKNNKGEILLGLRKNSPAKSRWFVPGGRIRKGEKLDDAFRRITKNELNQSFDRGKAKLLNIYEHIYENENKYSIEGLDTHYVVISYVIEDTQTLYLVENDQHSKFIWMNVEELLSNDSVHIYTKYYFNGDLIR
jgi:colanic acid biosynthesis protein WcaH